MLVWQSYTHKYRYANACASAAGVGVLNVATLLCCSGVVIFDIGDTPQKKPRIIRGFLYPI